MSELWICSLGWTSALPTREQHLGCGTSQKPSSSRKGRLFVGSPLAGCRRTHLSRAPSWILSCLDFTKGGSLWENRRKKCRELLLVHARRSFTPLSHLSTEMSIFLLLAQVAAGQIPGPIMKSQALGKGLAVIKKDQTDHAGGCPWPLSMACRFSNLYLWAIN